MSFGYERQPRALLNNTVILNAFLYSSDDQTLIPALDIHSVLFTIKKPEADEDFEPILDQVDGTVVADGHGQYLVAANINDAPGEYRAFATFDYDDQGLVHLVKSITVDYEIIDPLVRTGTSPADPSVAQAWLKLEDCFDSEEGGPWLRDMTLSIFDKGKVRALVPEVLLAINQQMPFTDFNEAGFPYANHDGGALMAQGLLVATIRHLMRSYTEQPDITSSPVAFMDRKKYQQSWAAIYTIEKKEFDHWLKRWKLRAYDLSHSALLLGNKAGRNIPAPMRTRWTARGF